jgi:SpoVK/Ycf46/Vps4 family AAA+-type ATPase
MSDQEDELSALIQSCVAHPASGTLLMTMMNEAMRRGQVEAAVEFLANLNPEIQNDSLMRGKIREFLTEAGKDDMAARWVSTPAVISLATYRHVVDSAPVSDRPLLTFADVGGLEQVKRQIHRRIIAPSENPGLFQRFGRRSGGGILLYGPPGCGKTMLVRATAGEAKINFISVSISEVLDRWLGESEKRLVAAFTEAQQRKPAILFFDEIEALAGRRNYDSSSTRASLVSTFLSSFDISTTKSEGILVIAATNVPWAIDGAFRRPGRFDRMIFVPPPDKVSRLAILRGLTANRPLASGVNLEKYAANTAGFSGADLMNLVETAIDLAIEQEMIGEAAPQMTRKHFDKALEEVKPTTLEWLATAKNYAKYATEPGIYSDLLAFLEKNER